MQLVTSIRSWEELLDFANPERVSENPEDHYRCIARERGQEIQIAQEAGIPVVYALRDPKQGMIRTTGFHKELGDYTLWKNPAEAVTVATGTAIIRAYANNEELVTRAAQNAGLTPLNENRDNRFIGMWVDWVKPEFLGRQINRITMSELLEGKGERFADSEGNIFIKTEDKKIHGICKADETWEVISYDSQMLPENTPFLVSQPMTILEDEHGKKEWRVWIADGKPTSFSRYLDYITDYETPEEIKNFVEQFVAKHDIPTRVYVLDVAETDEGPKVIELNSLPGSGRYAKNDFLAFLQQLQQSQQKQSFAS
jgi:ATP-grasp domain, R2K clade family 3